MASAELSPLCRVGGLAEVTAGLSAGLTRLGADVTVVIPGYEPWPELEVIASWPLDVPAWVGGATAVLTESDDLGSVVLIDLPGLARAHPYNDETTGHGWDDNDRRFLGFSAAVAALAIRLQPDIVHLHDWHTAAAAAWLPPEQAVVLTIHNLVYQGQADRRWVEHLGSVGDAFDLDQATNPLAGGIALADRVVTVSPAYATETRRPAFGAGLDDLLRQRGGRYSGIRNGIDVERWDPSTDPYLPAPFDALDLTGKDRCRQRLAELAGFDDTGLDSGGDASPIIGMVCRLVDQKGVDIALEVAGQLRGLGARFVLVGRGEPGLEAAATALAERNDRVAYLRTSDEATAHLLMAGSDLLLVPSRFEPCGLTPMEAMRCGTIPVVSPVGGLRDTIIDASADGVLGNGFIAPAIDAVGISLAVGRAVRALDDPARRAAIQRNGMTTDWSWRAPAAAYLDLYADVLAERAASPAMASFDVITASTSSRISGLAFEGAPAS